MTLELSPLDTGRMSRVPEPSRVPERVSELESAATTGWTTRWMSPASGLWVAARRGEHAGMVERVEGRYHARNARGREVGVFDDLDTARAAIDRHSTPDAVSRRDRRLTRVMVGVNAAIAALAAGLAILLLR